MSRKRPAEDSAEGDDAEAQLKPPVTGKGDRSYFTRDVLASPKGCPPGQCLKLMSWNVNGLKSLKTTNMSVLTNLIAKHQPDVLCLQVIQNILPLSSSYWK
jgi:hypothetical protein